MNFQKYIALVLLILIGLSSCTTTELPPSAATVTAEPTADLTLVTDEPVIPSPMPEPTAAAESEYPFYLRHATKLENVSQTIDGVTVQIDSAYVDEARVAIQYTISGLAWPDGSFLDNTQFVEMSIPVISTFQLGGFSGAGGGNASEVKQGVVTASSDQLLLDGALDAEKHPTVTVDVDIPVEGPTKVGTFHLSFTAPVRNGIKMENIDQTVVASDVAMTLKSLILNPSHAEALICFQMPSAVDWGLFTSRITVGDQEYPFMGGGIAYEAGDLDSALTSSERCNELGFDVVYDESVRSVTVTVPRLQASVNEVVTPETVAIANQRLANRGITFDYVNVDNGGNFVILQRPAGMSDEELYPLIWDALAEQYEGPWVFTVPIP